MTRTIANDELTESIIGAAIEVHRSLGPGLLESSYSTCMAHELKLRNMSFRKEVELPMEYKGIKLATGYRIDMIVEDMVILEFKVVASIEKVHEAQLLIYMRLSQKSKGLLINFQVAALKDGIQRMVL